MNKARNFGLRVAANNVVNSAVMSTTGKRRLRMRGWGMWATAQDWSDKPDVERVVLRRGFAEAITMPSVAFIRDAEQLFTFHPILDVTLSDLHTYYSFERPGQFEARLATDRSMYNDWPAELFSDHAIGTTLYYRTREAALADLARHAAGYGRRKAGVLRDPPPLPTRPLIPVEAGFRYGAPRITYVQN